MGKWSNSKVWQGLVDGSACPICVRGVPLHVIGELESSWLTMPEDATAAGYVCLVSRVHVVELHDLSESQAAAFMRDVRRVSRAVSAATGAVKLNYEIHGNTIPHLHMHFFPRRPGDRLEGAQPGLERQPVYALGQFAKIKHHLLVALQDTAG